MRAVIVSFRYADFLSVTLPTWKACLPKGTLTVVTAPNDGETIGVAKRHRVPLFLTNAWTTLDESCHVGATKVHFNKALALDHALGLHGVGKAAPALDELCVTLDADVVPEGPWPAEDTFEPWVLYGVRRYKCDNHQELIAHRRGDLSLCVRDRDMRNHRPSGYCQAFRYWPGIRFGSYPSAGYYDRDFGDRFAKKVMRDDFSVIHLGRKGGFFNWRRRKLPIWNTRPPKRTDANR
jgi:hypothetical protein